ncbi:Ig-like domain-containing protein, partial [Flavobacteriaceae bacterium]|nr:Ig-like domain-containing protein [Flavobacteriaceae bacterium]
SSSNPANTRAFIGFTTDFSEGFVHTQTTIDYAFSLNNGNVSVVENNSTKAANVTTITTTDRLRIERTGAGIRYYKNSTLLYTSLTASTGTLYVDTSFNTPGSVLSDLYIHEFGFATTPVYTVNTAGTTPELDMNAITGDDVIDNTEDNRTLFVSGTATNVLDGTTVNFTANGVAYSATVNANMWSVNIPSIAVATLPTSSAFIATVVIDGVNFTANRTVTRDISLPSINFIGGATSFTDPSVATQVAILFREAVSDLEVEDFFVEGGTLSNLVTSDNGTIWRADFIPSLSTSRDYNSISLGNNYTVVSTGSAPVVTETPIIWSDLDPQIIVTNTNDLSVASGATRGLAASGLNFPLESGSSISFDVPTSALLGLNYKQRNANTNFFTFDYAASKGGTLSSVTARIGGANYNNSPRYSGLHIVTFTRRGDNLLLFFDTSLAFTYPTFLTGPIYPIVAINGGSPTSNARVVQDVTISSEQYSVQTDLNIEAVSINGNVLTVEFDQVLDNSVSLPSGSVELFVGGASNFISDTTISGNQLLLTFSGSIANSDLVTLQHTPIGGLGIRGANGAVLGSSKILFGNGGPTLFQNPPIANNNVVIGSDTAEEFYLESINGFVNAGGGNDIIHFGGLQVGPYRMIGGSGSDTFIKDTIGATDILGQTGRGEYQIMDFTSGVGGDVINASTALNYSSAAGDDLIKHVQLLSNGTDTLIRFAHPRSPSSFSSAVRLVGVTGVTLAQLIADGNLIIE